MVRKHSDCFFQMYTNGTLIDEPMAGRLAEAGNLIPAISVEGFERRTDERRGQGVYRRILDAMANLRRAYVDWNGKVMPCVFVPYSPANIQEIYRSGGSLNDIYDLPYFRAIRQWQCDYGLGKALPEEHGNWLLPCSLRDHYGMGRGLIDQYGPEPEDQAAAEALQDGQYYEGMMAYDEALYSLFDPIGSRSTWRMSRDKCFLRSG